MTIWLVLTFAGGSVTGSLLTARNMHRLVARLDPKTRLAFARKVNSLARR